jgi:hypothetical protein
VAENTNKACNILCLKDIYILAKNDIRHVLKMGFAVKKILATVK